MKYFISLFILCISINCYSETNRQILEDIRDEIEFMQYERLLKQIERNSELSPYVMLPQQRAVPASQMTNIGVDSESNIHFIDVRTISSKSSNVMSFNILINFSNPRRIDSSNALSKKVEHVLNCPELKIFTIRDAFFSEKDGAGRVVGSNFFDRVSEPLSANSIYMRYKNFVCNR